MATSSAVLSLLISGWRSVGYDATLSKEAAHGRPLYDTINALANPGRSTAHVHIPDANVSCIHRSDVDHTFKH